MTVSKDEASPVLNGPSFEKQTSSAPQDEVIAMGPRSKRMDGCWFYILRCADGSYYTGTSRSKELETRVSQHNQGIFGGYTAKRRPVALVYSAHFDSILDAIAYERQVKGWSRAKKEALIRGDFDALQGLSKRRRAGRNAGEADTI